MANKAALVPLRDKVAAFAILAVLIGGIGCATWWRAGHINASDASMLYAGLPADQAEANATFRSRILSNFPLLSQEDNLIQTLARQGFKSDGWFSKRMTFRRHKGGARGCDFTASVVWESDDHARISALDPRFLRTPGCVDAH
jgi:hypothetical protein